MLYQVENYRKFVIVMIKLFSLILFYTSFKCFLKDDMIEDKCGAQVHSFYDDVSKQVQSPSAESPLWKKLAINIHSPSKSSTLYANALPNSSSHAETSQFKFERKLPCSQNSSGINSRQLLSPPAVESGTAQTRKICYGWLSSDDEEDPDPVKLEPAT